MRSITRVEPKTAVMTETSVIHARARHVSGERHPLVTSPPAAILSAWRAPTVLRHPRDPEHSRYPGYPGKSGISGKSGNPTILRGREPFAKCTPGALPPRRPPRFDRPRTLRTNSGAWDRPGKLRTNSREHSSCRSAHRARCHDPQALPIRKGEPPAGGIARGARSYGRIRSRLPLERLPARLLGRIARGAAVPLRGFSSPRPTRVRGA